MPKSLINLARLEADFEKWPERAFSKSELESIFAESPVEWNLPRSMTSTKFIAMLRGRSKLSRVTLKSADYPPLLRYVWRLTLRRAKVPYFRLYDLRSTYATRLSAGGVADEWVTQLLRQSDSKVFKKYSQMKLRMQREALEKMNRQANEMTGEVITAVQESKSLCTVPAQF